MILTKDVFMSWKHFSITWEKALEIARESYKYIDFNGYIFDVNIDDLDYTKAICMREDLVDEDMIREKTFIVVVSKGFGEYTEVYTLNSLDDAKEEVKIQLKDKVVETAEDYALVYELIPGEKNPKFICNDSSILNLD